MLPVSSSSFCASRLAYTRRSIEGGWIFSEKRGRSIFRRLKTSLPSGHRPSSRLASRSPRRGTRKTTSYRIRAQIYRLLPNAVSHVRRTPKAHENAVPPYRPVIHGRDARATMVSWHGRPGHDTELDRFVTLCPPSGPSCPTRYFRDRY